MKQNVVLLTLSLAFFFTACKKESFIESPDARVRTSTDSLHFDTVFTTVGSVTQFFRIYNENNQKLRLSEVTLSGGPNSPFKINADGITGPQVTNLEIGANDSLYVFVSTHINPNAGSLPFVVRDSIMIAYNGNKKWVQLEAWGKPANFLRSRKLVGNQVWTNNLPYVILGGIQVDTTATLTIQKGTRIYLHANAPFIVDGTLKVQGGKEDSNRVYFSGDRLDDSYRDFPAGWPGLYFRGQSVDNQLDFAVIRNAYQAVVADQPSANANPKLTLNQCIINNAYDAGILGIRTSITANNCLVSNCGKNVILVRGGNYNFTHCTLAAYSNSFILRKNPVLQVSNFMKQDNTIYVADLNASFVNSIFWGETGAVDDEVVSARQGNTIFNLSFTNCLWRIRNNPTGSSSTNMINSDPRFDSIDTQKKYFDFHLKSGSPAINKGVNTSLVIDLDGRPRANGIPDLGAYEK